MWKIVVNVDICIRHCNFSSRPLVYLGQVLINVLGSSTCTFINPQVQLQVLGTYIKYSNTYIKYKYV